MGHRLTIVIRTADERTAAVCTELVSSQARRANIQVLNERPFEAALRKTYETGIRLAAPWTMTVDGDVLLRNGAIEDFVASAEELPSNFVQIEGRVHDKLVGSYRQAGHRIYRTALLSKALQLVPNPGEQIRPEFSVLHKMALLGHPSRRIGAVLGIHDYEQFYRDLYRKAFVHANKHPELIHHFVTRAKASMQYDLDFKVFLRGLRRGLEHSGPVHIDVAAFGDRAAELTSLGLQERPRLQPDAFGFDDVDRLLAQAGKAEDFYQYDLQTNGEWGPSDAKVAGAAASA